MAIKKIRAFDILGNIAIVNFPKEVNAGHRSVYTRRTQDPKALNAGAKKKFANKIMKENKSIKTVLEKVGKVKGRLRKPTTKYIAGEKTKEVLYKENDCVFRFNIDHTYFSPRLSNERKEIAKMIKKGDEVLVMFAGVAPFSIVIAKNSKAKKVVSVEINREANKYANLNVGLNKVKNKVEVVQKDVKKFISSPTRDPALGFEVISQNRSPTHPKLVAHLCSQNNKKQLMKNPDINSSKKSRAKRDNLTKFDVIVMPRPQLKDSFLKEAFKFSKKGTRIYYYDFCKQDETNKIVEKIEKEAKQYKKKINILRVKKAGEIAPYKIRCRVDFVVC